jgi:hypothetical protein
MRTEILAVAALVIGACSRDTGRHGEQVARIMPNGTDPGRSAAKCAWLGSGDLAAACVRALRGDVCGDGTAHTVDGTLIEVSTYPMVSAEAEWSPAGAVCVGPSARPGVSAAASTCGVPVLESCGSNGTLATRVPK